MIDFAFSLLVYPFSKIMPVTMDERVRVSTLPYVYCIHLSRREINHNRSWFLFISHSPSTYGEMHSPFCFSFVFFSFFFFPIFSFFIRKTISSFPLSSSVPIHRSFERYSMGTYTIYDVRVRM